MKRGKKIRYETEILPTAPIEHNQGTSCQGKSCPSPKANISSNLLKARTW